MNYQQELEQLNNYLRDTRPTWNKNDYQALSGKATTRGRLLGSLSRGYYQKERLWKSGHITYGYLYKTYTDMDFSRPYLAWLLLSPQLEFEQSPGLYEKVYALLEAFMKDPAAIQVNRKLMHALTNPANEAKYFLIPTEYSLGKLVYVTTTYIYPDMHPDVKLGITPLIVAPEFTKEVMLLPSLYFSNEKHKDCTINQSDFPLGRDD